MKISCFTLFKFFLDYGLTNCSFLVEVTFMGLPNYFSFVRVFDSL